MELRTPEDSDGGPDSDPDPGPASLSSVPASGPGGHRCTGVLYVPVRQGSAGGHQLRFARTPSGARTVVAFTSLDKLVGVAGGHQPWVRLAEPALRALAEPLGAHVLTVDPGHTSEPPAAPPRATGRQPASVPCARRAVDQPEAMPV